MVPSTTSPLYYGKFDPGQADLDYYFPGGAGQPPSPPCPLSSESNGKSEIKKLSENRVAAVGMQSHCPGHAHPMGLESQSSISNQGPSFPFPPSVGQLLKNRNLRVVLDGQNFHSGWAHSSSHTPHSTCQKLGK